MALILRLASQPLHAVKHVFLLCREGVPNLLHPVEIAVQLIKDLWKRDQGFHARVP